jgi:hypothetical protein
MSAALPESSPTSPHKATAPAHRWWPVSTCPEPWEHAGKAAARALACARDGNDQAPADRREGAR